MRKVLEGEVERKSGLRWRARFNGGNAELKLGDWQQALEKQRWISDEGALTPS